MNPALLDWLASVNHDPYAFVLGAFPWGEADTSLSKWKGPEPWQITILNRIRDGLPIDKAIQLATCSGHGVGKSALVAWIILWAISTLPDTKGVVTANTEPQLKTKTWPELGKWYNLCLTKELFKFTATALFSVDSAHEKTWRVDMVPWSENNPEAFAGLHNQGRRVLVIFDEASAISDKIWETTEGVMTDADTEIMWIVFGNPTRNSGRFRECWPGQKHGKSWQTMEVDSRTVSFTNKAQIQKWIDREGEDSDFARIRVKGMFPRTGMKEFISNEDVDAARSREASSDRADPFVIGVDVARYGSAESVLFFRKGRDAQSVPPRCFRGLSTVELATKVAEAYHEFGADAIFIDGGGVGGGVVDNVRALHIHCFDIQFGGKADNDGFVTGNDGEKYAQKRSQMWGAMRAWLKFGAIPDDSELRAQLIGPTYTYNLRNEIQLEKKEDMVKRGLESPDRADALALTFAYPVAKSASAGGLHPHEPLVQSEYNPFSQERMAA